MFPLAVAAIDGPQLENVMTTGGYVIAAIVATFGTIQVAKINNVSRRVERTVEQTKETGNGYAKRTKTDLEDIKDRLASQDRQTLRRDELLDRILVKFDDRLLRIEDHLSDVHPRLEHIEEALTTESKAE